MKAFVIVALIRIEATSALEALGLRDATIATIDAIGDCDGAAAWRLRVCPQSVQKEKRGAAHFTVSCGGLQAKWRSSRFAALLSCLTIPGTW